MALTDSQVGMIAAAIPVAAGALGALIRSAAVIFRDAKIETTTRWEDALKQSNAVIRDNAIAFANLMQALGTVDARTQDVGRRVVEIHRETSDVYAMSEPSGGQDVSFDDDRERDTPVEIPAQSRTPTREREHRTPRGGIAPIGRITPPQGNPVTGGGPTQPRPASSPYSITTNPKRRGGD